MNRRAYLRHFITLMSGTVLAQLVNLASYPFLVRLYTPTDFGVFAIFVAVVAVPSTIACGRFDLAVPIAPRRGRHAIVWLCFTVSAAMGALSAVGSLIYWFVQQADVDLSLSALLGLCVWLTGVTQAAALYLMRHDFYRISSASLLVRTGGTMMVQIGLAFVWPSAISLILGFTIGLVLQAAMLTGAIYRHTDMSRPRLAQVVVMFRRYRRQVSVDIPSTLIAAVSLNLPTFQLATLFGDRAVGFYALASRIAIMPLQLVNDALGQVFFQKAARAQQERGEFWGEMKFNLLTSSILSLGVLLGLWMFAEPFIGIYLGREWLTSGQMLLILAPMLAARSLCMSIATAVFVLHRPQWLLWHNIANASALAASYGYAIWTGMGLMSYLMLISAVLLVEYSIFAIFLVFAARHPLARE